MPGFAKCGKTGEYNIFFTTYRSVKGTCRIALSHRRDAIISDARYWGVDLQTLDQEVEKTQMLFRESMNRTDQQGETLFIGPYLSLRKPSIKTTFQNY